MKIGDGGQHPQLSDEQRAVPSELDSAAAQSIGVPSRIASARSSSSRSLGGTFHLLGQPDEGPLRRLARRVRRGLPNASASSS